MTNQALLDFYAKNHIGTGFHVVDVAHPIPPGHLGQDIRGHEMGTWIPSIAAGTVASIGYDGTYGNYIGIRISDDRVVYYCHLSNTASRRIGQKIAFAEGVAPLGDTGYSFGPHLHMGVGAGLTPQLRRGLVDPLPYIISARTAAAGGGVTPLPPDPTPETRKVNPVISIFFSFRSGVGQFLVYVSPTRVSITSELSTASPANRAAAINTALAVAKAAGLPYTTESQIPVLDDSPNGGWYLRNQVAYAAAGMPSTFALSSSNPYQISLGGAGALTPAQDAALMGLPAAINDLPTNGEMGQALTSTVALVNKHADSNKQEILDAIDDIPGGGSGGSSAVYSLSIDVPAVPGTATGTATPQ